MAAVGPWSERRNLQSMGRQPATGEEGELDVLERDRLQEHAGTIGAKHTVGLVFIEPQTSSPFDFRRHKITRTALPISHAQVLTSTACQGRTMTQGVIVDAGCKDSSDMDNLWLHLYVMLSRATTAENLLVIRDPGLQFLSRGPPNDLETRLCAFQERTQGCRTDATSLARELGLMDFLRDDAATR